MSSLTNNYIKKIESSRSLIIETGKLLYEKGLIAGRDGNISLRTGPATLLTTCSGTHKGMLTEEDLVEVDFSTMHKAPTFTTPHGAGCKPSSELAMHTYIYVRDEEARAIIHAHAPWTTAITLRKDDAWLDMTELAEGRILFGKVPVVPLIDPGTEELAKAVAENFPMHKAVILKGHGAVTAGKDMEEALSLMEALEHNARILALSAML